ncbi:guanine nucleotide binding protein, alpha subunit [Auriculariales sp. MPI-PUGE-AT-0066]|nr:guanine nucleotide binding protein, alpha subunit [Auriculariales sp. MPI-PUGE-AT-0066]
MTVPHDDPFARFMQPPANETAEQAEERMRAQAEAQRISDEIDEQIKQEKASEKKFRPFRLLLLGQSESGKSTTLKNFQLMYTPKQFERQRVAWRAVIQLNLARTIHTIVDALTQVEEGAVGFDGRELPLLDQDIRTLKMRVLPLLPLEEQLKKRLCASNDGEATIQSPDASSELAVAPTWRKHFGRLLGRNERDDDESLRSIDFNDPSDPAYVLSLCSDDIRALWQHPQLRVVLKQLDIRLETESGFFLNEVDRIAQRDYVPSDDDVLRCRLKTLGVSEFKFKLETTSMPGLHLGASSGQEWRIYDVGGARSQRLFWAPFFDMVDAIIFLAPISCFDQTLAEDKNINRLEDSVLLWRDVCENKLLKDCQLVLFLNKIDLLKAKLQSGVKFSRYVTTFADRTNDYEGVSNYLKRKFAAIQKEKSLHPRPFYCHFTSVTDPAATQTLLARVSDLVVRANFKDSNLI